MQFNQSRQLVAALEKEVHSHRITRREALVLVGGTALSGLLSSCMLRSKPVSSVPVAVGPLHYTSLTNVARLIESRKVSPVELTQMMLERIAAVDGQLQSYATVTAERALAAARKSEAEITSGDYRGPLHGMPIAVKDLCYTKGIRTMGGLSILRDFVPTYDATVVSRLEKAGAVLLGKLNLTEGAMAGYHPDFEIPVNPWGTEYWAGASSSGSGVATAAGLCFASLGSDTGGSIRFPSMANGTVGLKPTYGRVSRYGVLSLAESLDHVGPMTRCTADAAIMLEAIAGYDNNDPTSLREPVPNILTDLHAGINGMRIAVDRRFSAEGSDSGLIESIEQALVTLVNLGAIVVDIQIPKETKQLGQTWFEICAAEAYKAHATNFPSRTAEYGPYFREFLRFGATVTSEQYSKASDLRRSFNHQYSAVLSQVDAIVCPSGGFTFPIVTNQRGDTATLQPLIDAIQMQFTIPADFAGTPTLTLPCGFSKAGVPYALQFMGRRLSEPLLCRIGNAYEEATEWHNRHPPI